MTISALCNQCRATGPIEGRNVVDALRMAEAQGWKVSFFGRSTLCPKCRTTPAPTAGGA